MIVGGILLLAGCQAPPQSAGPTDIILRVPDYEVFVDDSLSLLRRCDFPPEYVDRTRGLVISKPATSGQWFEPWRVDSQGGYQLLESSLHTMRRVVTINIEPLNALADTDDEEAPPPSAATETQPVTAEDTPGTTEEDSRPAPRYRVAVRVDKSRYSAPERQVTTASGALAIYNERLPTTEGLRGARSRGEQWVPLGRDKLLEAFLLARLAEVSPEVEAAE